MTPALLCVVFNQAEVPYHEGDYLFSLENTQTLNPFQLMKLTEVNSDPFSCCVVLFGFGIDCSELHLNVLLMRCLVTVGFYFQIVFNITRS